MYLYLHTSYWVYHPWPRVTQGLRSRHTDLTSWSDPWTPVGRLRPQERGRSPEKKKKGDGSTLRLCTLAGSSCTPRATPRMLEAATYSLQMFRGHLDARILCTGTAKKPWKTESNDRSGEGVRKGQTSTREEQPLELPEFQRSCKINSRAVVDLRGQCCDTTVDERGKLSRVRKETPNQCCVSKNLLSEKKKHRKQRSANAAQCVTRCGKVHS